MKRIIAMSLIVVSVLLLVSCDAVRIQELISALTASQENITEIVTTSEESQIQQEPLLTEEQTTQVPPTQDCNSNGHSWDSGKWIYNSDDIVQQFDFTCIHCNETKTEYVNDNVASNVAQIVLDQEAMIKARTDQFRNERPDLVFLDLYVSRVLCFLHVAKDASADDLVKQYDLASAFPNGNISVYEYINYIVIDFPRNDFTEQVYQALEQFSEQEPMITGMGVEVSDYSLRYMPNIMYYSASAAPITFTVTDTLPNLLYDQDFLIKSKQEYDAYLDFMLEHADFTNQKTVIESKRDLYDDSFFSENALIITHIITRSSGSIELTVNDLYSSEGKIYVIVRTDEPSSRTDDMQYTTFTVQVSQQDVAGVEQIITLE